jgi:hypothetical protein
MDETRRAQQREKGEEYRLCVDFCCRIPTIVRHGSPEHREVEKGVGLEGQAHVDVQQRSLAPHLHRFFTVTWFGANTVISSSSASFYLFYRVGFQDVYTSARQCRKWPSAAAFAVPAPPLNTTPPRGPAASARASWSARVKSKMATLGLR